MDREGEINKMASSDRNISCRRQEERASGSEGEKSGAVMTQKGWTQMEI